MRYIPTTPDEQKKMLETAGAKSLDELFACIPDALKLKRPLDLPEGMSENRVLDELQRLASLNHPAADAISFLGGGSYAHYVPAVVNHMLLREEFFTSYTPYQPETSQGTLQNIFEYQTMMCQLTGMEVSNASLYDGASALAEGVLMAQRLKRKKPKVLVSRAVHPQYRETLLTFTRNLNVEIVEVPYDAKTGATDLSFVKANIDDGTAALAVQSPNVFGVVENFTPFSEAIQNAGGLMISVTAEAYALPLLKPPGEQGVDICVGEAMSFAGGLNFGGPSLGFLTTRDSLKRAVPGRLVGETVDTDGKRGYVLTLATREQHIRREKATSNICTNQGLVLLAAAISMAAQGKKGLTETAGMNAAKAHSFSKTLESAGFTRTFSGSTFNEFVVTSPAPVKDVLSSLKKDGIMGGLTLKKYYPELKDHLLVCLTEMVSGDEMKRAASAFKKSL